MKKAWRPGEKPISIEQQLTDVNIGSSDITDILLRIEAKIDMILQPAGRLSTSYGDGIPVTCPRETEEDDNDLR